MIRVLLSKSTCSIMKFANRVIVSANRKCTWNSREIRTWKRVVLMGKRLKIIYIKILWGGKYNKYIIKFVLWDCFWIFLLSNLYGFVDWNWTAQATEYYLQGRSLYGFVDWNSSAGARIWWICVEAYTASWIEIKRIDTNQLLL